jgi:hypothetical protein
MRICWIRENRLILLKVGWIRDIQFKTNLFKSGFVIHDTNRTWIRFVKAWIDPFSTQDL